MVQRNRGGAVIYQTDEEGRARLTLFSVDSETVALLVRDLDTAFGKEIRLDQRQAQDLVGALVEFAYGPTPPQFIEGHDDITEQEQEGWR